MIEGGTIFGEESPTSRRSRNAYAEGVEESEVAVLSRSDLEALIRNNPEVELRLASLVAELLRGPPSRPRSHGGPRRSNLVHQCIEEQDVRTATGTGSRSASPATSSGP